MRKSYDDYMDASVAAAESGLSLSNDIDELGQLEGKNTDDKNRIAEGVSTLFEHALATEQNAALWGIGAELAGIRGELETQTRSMPERKGLVPVRAGLLTTGQRRHLINAKAKLEAALPLLTEGGPASCLIDKAIAAIDSVKD